MIFNCPSCQRYIYDECDLEEYNGHAHCPSCSWNAGIHYHHWNVAVVAELMDKIEKLENRIKELEEK